MDSDWARVIVGTLFAIVAGVLGKIWHRQDRHEDDVYRRLDRLREETVPRADLQSLVYSGIMQAIRDSNADFRGEVGRQMGLLAGRLDDVLGQVSRMRDAQQANRQDLIIMATKLGVDLPRSTRE